MISPEAQQYITQSRASGIPDDQIRQNLIGQGWPQADVDQIIGVASFSLRKAFPLWAKVLIAFIILLVVTSSIGAATGWFGFSKFNKDFKDETGIDVSQLPKGNPATPKDLCGSWPGNEGDLSLIIKAESTLSSEFPVSFQAPRAAYVATMGHTSDISPKPDATRNIGIYFFCTDDSLKTIFDYYKNLKAAGWSVSGDYIPDDKQNQFSKGGQFLDAVTPVSNNAFYAISIAIQPQGNKSLVKIIYSVAELGQ